MVNSKNQKKKPLVVQPRHVQQKKAPVPTESFLKPFLPLLFILPVVFAAYFPILDNDLTNWDDPDLIIDNPLIRDFSFEGIKRMFTTFYFGNYQPLHLLAYTIQYHLWGLNPTGYHAVSLFLFLTATSLVYYFIFQISKRNLIIAVIATLLFAVNAMRVESVAWAAEHKDMLYLNFYLASLIAYVKYIAGKGVAGKSYPLKFYLFAFLFFVLAVFSKVMAVSIVGPMVMLDYFYSRRISIRMILEKIPYVALSITIGLIQIDATASAGTIDKSNVFTFFDRILIVCRNLMFYVHKTLVPVNLSAFHPYPQRLPGEPWPVEFYIAPVFVLLLAALLLWSLRRTRILLFCTGFFVAGLALVLQFVAIGPSMFNERYSLIPSVALSFGLAAGIWYLMTRYPGYKNIFLGIAGGYLILMFYLTFARCDVWQTSLTLWDDAIEQYPYASMPLNNRGKFYGKDLGNTTKAMADLTAAIKYDKAYEQPYSNRGIIYCINGKFDSAIADFDNAIRLNSEYYEAISNRGIAYASTNRPAQALEDFTKCLELEPNKPDVYLNRGYCYMQLNQPDKALDDFNAGISLAPGNPEFYLRRAYAYFGLKQYENAYNDLQTARNAGARVENVFFEQVKKAAGK
jgi:tetratricopeptide (TPR) repeat protein